MPIRPPTEDDLQELASELYLDLTPEEREFFQERIVEQLDDYETIRSSQPEPRLGGTEPRTRSSGTRPDDADNPHQMWVTRCTVEGDEDVGSNPNSDADSDSDPTPTPSSDLADWDVGIKDNICVAGVEMTCGSQVVEGYVPDVDATVVSRLLEAGADIVGKTNMDDMAITRTGHSAFGTITNPRDPDHLAGGSSGGSAVAVVEDAVDVAIGSDQGGSVRIPAAICGIVGHKPTYGLVPYTGCVGLEHTIDHPGPMAPDVEMAAKTLTAIAGSNERDLRRPADVPVERYEDALDGDPTELTIGVLQEGFGKPSGDPAVDDRVLDALELLEERGATVEDVSVPLHSEASALHSVCTNEGVVAALSGQGVGHGWKAWYNVTWIESFGKFRQAQSDDFPAALKLSLLAGAYTAQEYHSRFYAAGMNLVVELATRYDELLDEYDVLAMPTVDVTAPEHDPERDEFERMQEVEIPGNTSPFNRTGHPAVSVPAGEVDGLPVGCMFVGSRFDDATVLDAGYALEQARSEASG